MKRIFFIFSVTIGFMIFFFLRFYMLIAIPVAALSLKMNDSYSKMVKEVAGDRQTLSSRILQRVTERENAVLRFRDNEERRSGVRSQVALSCVVSGLSHGQRIHESAKVININQRGMYIEAMTPLDESSEMEAQIKAMRFGKPLWAMGKVLRSSTKGMAVQFAVLVQERLKFIPHTL